MYKKCRVIWHDVEKSPQIAVKNVSNCRVPSVIDQMLVTSSVVPHGSCKSVKYVNDVYLLLNQKRLDRMSLESFSSYLDSISDMSTSSFSELRKNVGDKELLQFVKSRYIQSRSELMAWTSYLTSQMNNVKQAAADYVESQKQTDVEPSSSNE